MANKATTAPSMQLYGEGKLQGVSSTSLYQAERPTSQACDGTWGSIPHLFCRPSSAFQSVCQENRWQEESQVLSWLHQCGISVASRLAARGDPEAVDMMVWCALLLVELWDGVCDT